MNNKWTLTIKDNYIYDNQIIVRDTIVSIPPTDKNRTDIMGESRKYYYNITKKEFKKKIKNREIKDQISVIIEIINGNIKLST